MNVKFYTANTNYSNYHSLPVAGEKQAPTAPITTGTYDKVTIRKQQKPANDTGFAAALARTITDKLEEGASQGKVLKLQQEVAAQTYQPDARRIAERMLGYR